MKRTFWAISAAIVAGFFTAVFLCVQALSAQAVSVFSREDMRVVVDAGHGGIDVGVSGRQTGIRESDLNLAVALALKEELEERGFEVILTRKTEAGLYDTTAKGFKKRDMQRRKEIIAECDPALLLSVHQNFYPSKIVRGGQVFYSEKSVGSKELASVIQRRLNEQYSTQGARERKIKNGEYFMLRCHPCPSVIVECGFLSNAEDERLLQDKGWQRQLARCIASGVVEYVANGGNDGAA